MAGDVDRSSGTGPFRSIKHNVSVTQNAEGEATYSHDLAASEGHLPSADELLAYEAIRPGAAAQMLDMLLDEVGHRRGLENSDSRQAGWGLVGAIGVPLAFLLLGVGVILAGYPRQGAVIAVGVPAIAISSLIWGTRRN